MKTNYNSLLESYLKGDIKKEVNWFDLPETMYLLTNVGKEKKTQSVKKLISHYGKNKKLNKDILGVLISSKKGILKINFPLNLDQISYVKIYALMISEGSIKTEFSLNVPEKEFHHIFEKNLKKLISQKISIKKDLSHNLERSRAPTIIRHLIPIEEKLPSFLFENKKYAKSYLSIIFEAEGSPIYNLKRSKKYIKLSRNADISSLFKKNQLPLEKRIFTKELKEKYPIEYKKLVDNPPSLILGEYLLLKYCFNIESTLAIECIRSNRIGNRKGEISAKWVIYIYGGEDIKKFVNKIGFISNKKRKICYEMIKNIPSRKKQYFALEIMKEISNQGIFHVNMFNSRMKKIGYSSPAKFIWDYWKNKKIIERISRGQYKLLIN